MKILAFLQNQWFKDPERIKQIYAARPTKRRALNKAFLFAGCITGKRLLVAFGDMCHEIEWEEISPQIGGKASACFPPDHDHIKKVIDEVKPDMIIAFGIHAQKALASYPFFQVHCPHPASRKKDVPQELAKAADLVRQRLTPPH